MSRKDKNIDNFFKRRLKSNEFAYQESDWEALNEQLDEAGMVPSGNTLSISPMKLVIGGVLLGALAFWGGWFAHDQTLNQKQKLVAFSSKPSPEMLENQGSVSKDVLEEKPALVPTESLEKDSNLMEVPGATRRASHLDQAPLSETKHPPLTSVDTSVDPTDISKENWIGDGQVPTGKRIALSETSPIFNELMSLDLSKEDVFVNQGKNSRLSIAVSLAPDFNSVGMTSDKMISVRPGFHVYYQLWSRVSISGGVLYNRKIYKTGAEDYHAPEGYWKARTNGQLPSRIEGYCTVVDLPLNVSYQLTDNPKVNLAVTVGVSSYILLNEHYDFQFTEDNPGAAQSWETEENSKVMSGVGNLSLLMSARVARRTEILFEPYLKTPLKEVGWGKVSLYSTGFQVGVRQYFKSGIK